MFTLSTQELPNHMTGSFKQNYNMIKPRNIKLKHTILVSFLLLSLLSPTKNIAANHDRNGDTNYIITIYNANIPIDSWLASTNHVVLRTDTYMLHNISSMLNVHGKLGNCRFIYSLLFITGSIYTSLYNYFTEHNKKKEGWFRSKFFVYFGIKTNITKNFHLDLYFSLLNLCANLFVYYILTKGFLSLDFTKKDLPFIILILSLDINICIYKNFYFCLKPMSFFRICLLHIKRSSMHSEITKCLLNLFPGRFPQNPNLSNIHCWKPQEHTHFNTDNII